MTTKTKGPERTARLDNSGATEPSTQTQYSTGDIGPATAECSRGWADRCAGAKSHRCTCSCGGQNHGAKRQEKSSDETTDLPGFRYQYKGYSGCDCECQIEIIQRDGQPPIVIATDLAEMDPQVRADMQRETL